MNSRFSLCLNVGGASLVGVKYCRRLILFVGDSDSFWNRTSVSNKVKSFGIEVFSVCSCNFEIRWEKLARESTESMEEGWTSLVTICGSTFETDRSS